MQSFRYTNGYRPRGGWHPGSAALSIAICGGMIGSFLFLNPAIVHRFNDPPLTTYIVPPDVVPPKNDPQPAKPHQPIEQKTIYVPPIDPKIASDTRHDLETTTIAPSDPGTLGGTGMGTITFDPPKPAPLLTGVGLDPRYAGYLQPPYPADEQRAGRDGRVSVRVLVGIDGRVKAVEKLSAASDSFFEATRRQALTKWRFKPATRDGVPYGEWKVMNVSFVLNDDG